MMQAPYGAWTSPISAVDVAGSSHPVSGGSFVGDDVWWLELRADEGGRQAVRRGGPSREPEDVLPPPWNARTRVHEYGGGSWVATADAALVFAEFSDQRLYRLDPGTADPVPLTPEPPEPGAWRYGDLGLSADGRLIWCVREGHSGDGTVTRDIATVPLDGSAADDADAVVSVVSGSHFLASPAVSPDGTSLAWIAWEHPQMPWDGTELRVARLGASGVAADVRTLVGSTTESVLGPIWLDDSHLLVSSDRTGFWNLYRVGIEGGEPEALAPLPADTGGPLWELGTRWFTLIDADHVLMRRTFGTDILGVLDLRSGELRDLDLGEHTKVGVGAVRGREVLTVTGGALVPTGLRRLDLDTLELTTVRTASDPDVDPAYLPHAEPMTFTGTRGRDVHAIVYPPRNPDHTAPAGELPPYVALVHGGPTAQAWPMLSLELAYFTSRGIGAVDVNYGGSTGYGREYRERLRGQWGIVDVEDVVSAVQGLADAGLADPGRLAIQGGSAGGWTVLAALTGTDAFACGVSYFGVAELLQFAADTHDFESRYLDGLIGPLPEARELYETRAPVNNVGGLSCPVLLLQGLDDPVVPPSQAEHFRDALLEKRLPHAYVTYEGESHGFRRRETIVDALQKELSFYGQIMGFEPPEVPLLEIWRP